MQITYRVDGNAVTLEISGDLVQGDPVILSHQHEDPLRGQSWFSDGFSVAHLMSATEVRSMRDTLTGLVKVLSDEF